MRNDHVGKRETRPGIWLPAAFYAISLLGWFLAGATAGSVGLIWLVVLPLLPLGLYLFCTIRGGKAVHGATPRAPAR
jgi:hypothetical protein